MAYSYLIESILSFIAYSLIFMKSLFKKYAVLFCKFHLNMKSKWIYLYILVRFGELHSVFGGIFRVGCFQSRLCPGDIVLVLLSKGKKWP